MKYNGKKEATEPLEMYVACDYLVGSSLKDHSWSKKTLRNGLTLASYKYPFIGQDGQETGGQIPPGFF